MRVLILLILCACATVPVSDGYEEMQTCPAPMSEQQARSGIVRCTALCSSYARDFVSFGMDCKCYCAPAGGYSRPRQGGYVPQGSSQM